MDTRSSSTPPDEEYRFGDMAGVFARAGAMAPLLRGLRWAETAVGEPSRWPQSLRSAASICLGAKYPIAIYWGRDLTLIYNEAWSSIPGDKHPWALGRSGSEVWPEIWHIVGPQFEAALAGEGMFTADSLLPMLRHGYLEETYFDYNLSPIIAEDGRIEGVFNAGIETTERVLTERRHQLMAEVAAATANAIGALDACTSVADALESDPATIPFALVYLFPTPRLARLAASVAVTPGTAHAPDAVRLDREGGDPWRLGEVRRTRVPIVIDDLSDADPLPAGDWPVPPRSAVSLPIIRGGMASRRPVLGALVVGTPGGRPLDAAMVGFFGLLAEHLASAIVNAEIDEEERRSFEIEHHIAATLQRSLIPELPEVEGVDLRGRYLPGVDGIEVGGDWYDALALPGGEVALVMGDVMGKGVPAAAQMGQLRNALRAYLLEGFGPAEALARLNHLTISLSDASFATVLCVFYDPATRRIRWSRAGHLPPLVRTAAGATMYFDEGGSPPLAVFPDATFGDSHARLEPGDALVLYTDGLIERRGEGIDVGLARFAEQVTGLDTAPGMIDRIIAPVVEIERRDDVAVMVLVCE